MTKIEVRRLDFTRMKRNIFMVIVILALILAGNPVYSACDSTSCIPLGNDFSMKICAEYQGAQYEFKLNYIQDSSGLFWKMDISTFKQIQSGAAGCIYTSNDLAIKICCANYLDYNYAFTLNYTPYPKDPTGLYWKMDTATLVVTPVVLLDDPLFPFQWHLQNTGQTAFSQGAGTPGEDLRMTQALTDKLSGLGVIMAVLDYGLEIAHEDLSGNVIPNGSYNSAGSNLWISAPGGEYGTTSPAIITTDQSGVDKGYSRNDLVNPKNPFEIGDPTYNPNCNYTSGFNGTSSAAPNASGAIALLLQINPNLTRRDVKHILAKTARKIDPTSPESIVTVNLDGVDYQASQSWITNAAGYNFHNWYGFGAVNVDAAVAMAKNYQADSIPKPQDKSYGGELAPAVAIPDNNASGAISILEVPEDLTIENFFVQIAIEHPDTAEIGIEITSPYGTRSILVNIRSALKEGLDKDGGVVLGSNAFYGEKLKGTWTIKVLDSWPGKTGNLKLYKLRILGY